jgi:hypothetical protein
MKTLLMTKMATTKNNIEKKIRKNDNAYEKKNADGTEQHDEG